MENYEMPDIVHVVYHDGCFYVTGDGVKYVRANLLRDWEECNILHCNCGMYHKRPSPPSELLDKLQETLLDIRDNYDHDVDAHKYKTNCRKCEAEKSLALIQEYKNRESK